MLMGLAQWEEMGMGLDVNLPHWSASFVILQM